MSPDLVTVATFTTPVEAAAARAALDARGIFTHVTNEAITTWAWQLSNAVGGAKLQVPSDDADRAMQILADVQSDTPKTQCDSTTWDCAHCGNDVDADMDVCWYCGAARDGTRNQRMIEADAAEIEPEPSEDVQGGALNPWLAFAMIVFPPLLVGYAIWLVLNRHVEPSEDELAEATTTTSDDADPTESDEPLSPQQEQAIQLAQRAWCAAVLGVVFIPVVLSAYSLWITGKFFDAKQDVPHRYKRLVRIATVVNAVVLLAWVILPWWFYVSAANSSSEVPAALTVEEVIEIPLVPSY